MHEIKHIERAILVSLEFGDNEEDRASIQELRELVRTAGVLIVGEFVQKRQYPNVSNFLGHGKAEQLFADVAARRADLVIVNRDLTPTQQRNLEEIVGVRVIDRTQLILDIFAQRAHSSEGKLQVELAQLKYLLPRLTGTGTVLSRLGGGIGTRGPGETKLESDRRRIRKRIAELSKEIEEVRQRRLVQKQGRRRLSFPTAALVGYTSAGKSTLLNTLSGSSIAADSMLFSTLDPTTRKIVLPDGWAVLVTDTVGFIKDLPHDLIVAFRATLEEVAESDFLIHVVDAAHPQMTAQMNVVQQLLTELDVVGKPTVTVFNKSDLVDNQYYLRKLVADREYSVYISALKPEGIPELMAVLSKVLQSLLVRVSLEIPYERSDLVSLCYDAGRVLKAEYTQRAILVEAEVARDIAGKLEQYLRA